MNMFEWNSGEAGIWDDSTEFQPAIKAADDKAWETKRQRDMEELKRHHPEKFDEKGNLFRVW